MLSRHRQGIVVVWRSIDGMHPVEDTTRELLVQPPKHQQDMGQRTVLLWGSELSTYVSHAPQTLSSGEGD